MGGRRWWLAGAIVLAACDEVGVEGIEATELSDSVVRASWWSPEGVELESELTLEACDETCRWGCEAERCDVPVWTAVGAAHSCALREGGGVDCWGANDRGQLGDGTTQGRARAVRVSGVENATAIDAGAAHTCVLEGGAVACWGANERGQLGDGTTIDRATPVRLALGAEVVEIATGGARTCARTRGGEVSCWGEGVAAPEPVVGVGPAVDLDVGGTHACAVREGGTVWCWGENESGQLGDGTTSERAGAMRVLGLDGMTAVRAGRAHTCAIDALTRATCWGDNEHGQLGDGTTEDRPAPTVEHASVIAVGGDRTCGRVPFGEVACWGEGHGREPELVALLDEASVVTIGPAHGCAVHRIGTARCWGANGAGQLGLGTIDDAPLPVDALPPAR